MELIRIDEGKLKVMLTEEDMAQFALDGDAADCDSEGTRRAVYAILDAAREQIGFDAARDRICVRMLRGRTGGCELFVTCTGAGNAPCRLLYTFKSAERLAAACRQLAARDFSGRASAYLSDDGSFLLRLEAPRGARRPDGLDFLAEYGAPADGRSLGLHEHATLLTADAVRTLAPLAIR